MNTILAIIGAGLLIGSNAVWFFMDRTHRENRQELVDQRKNLELNLELRSAEALKLRVSYDAAKLNEALFAEEVRRLKEVVSNQEQQIAVFGAASKGMFQDLKLALEELTPWVITRYHFDPQMSVLVVTNAQGGSRTIEITRGTEAPTDPNTKVIDIRL